MASSAFKGDRRKRLSSRQLFLGLCVMSGAQAAILVLGHKSMCPPHSEAKQTTTLESEAEKSVYHRPYKERGGFHLPP